MRRLYSRIFLHFVGVLVVASVATFAVFTAGWRVDFVRNWALRYTRHVASVLGERWDDAGARERLVRHIWQDLDIDVTVRDADGRVLASGGPELPRRAEAEAACVGAKHEWTCAAPIVDAAGRARGTVETAPMRRFHPPPLWKPIVMVGFLLTLLGLGTAPLARRISRPVERLTEGSRRLAGGDLSYRVPQPRHWRRWRRADQLTELTRAWNEMAERVEGLVRGHKELLANVSHELRSPLARLRVALELMPRQAASQARLEQMEADLGELDALIETLLTSSRLEASGLPTELGRVDVAALFAQLVERARRDPLTAGQELRARPGEALALTADGALLLRALWNLIENAAKYGAPPITLAAEARGGDVVFSVRDEGPGIPAAERERVFTPFYRAGGAAPRRGFGLGLTLARRIAEVHGGTIRIDDGDGGRGCKVTLTLPARPA
jgi:signal transduction histidine kinase